MFVSSWRRCDDDPLPLLLLEFIYLPRRLSLIIIVAHTTAAAVPGPRNTGEDVICGALLNFWLLLDSVWQNSAIMTWFSFYSFFIFVCRECRLLLQGLLKSVRVLEWRFIRFTINHYGFSLHCCSLLLVFVDPGRRAAACRLITIGDETVVARPSTSTSYYNSFWFVMLYLQEKVAGSPPLPPSLSRD